MFTGKATDYPKHLLVFIVLIYWCVLSDEWQARRVLLLIFYERREERESERDRVREGKAGDGQALPGSIM